MLPRHIFLISALAGSVFAAASNNDAVFRERIAPVLQANCASCHGGATPAGGLAVASLDNLLSGGKHGSAITPGQASQSLLIQYVRGEKTPKMPMGGSLAANVITDLSSAIDTMQPLPANKARNAYAEWLLTKPKPPAIPSVERQDWIRNPIDAFILSKLESKGLTPAPPADRRA